MLRGFGALLYDLLRAYQSPPMARSAADAPIAIVVYLFEADVMPYFSICLIYGL